MNAVLTNQCAKCMTCVAECGLGLLTVNAAGFPELTPDREGVCIRCGHCEIVCPQAADGPNAQSVNAPQVTAEMLGIYMKRRRSIRSFKTQPVDRTILQQIMDIVRYAPSGMNLQPLHWVIVYDTREVRRMTDMVIEWMRQMVQISHPVAAALNCPDLIRAYEGGGDMICRNAPHVVVAYGPTENSSAPTDATIALAHLDLAAPAFGLGTCWAGFFQIAATYYPPLKQALGIPETLGALGSLMIGHPKYPYYQIPERNEAKIDWR